MIDWCEILGWKEEQINELRYLGYVYIRQGKYEIAQSFFEALVAVDPRSAYDVQTLGAIHLQKGETAKSLFYLDQSLKIDPEDLGTRLNRCKALLILGRVQEGIKVAKQLKALKDPECSDVAAALILAYH